MNRWWIEELAVQDEHVHMIIQINPRESVAEVVQKLKGGTSRIIRKAHPDLEEFLWGDSFWSDGYFVESIGKVSEIAITKYIQEQNKQANRDHGL